MNTEKMKSILHGVKSKKSNASKQNSSRPVFSSNTIIESFPRYLNSTIEDRDDYLRFILNSGFKKLIDTRTNLFKEYNRDFFHSDLYEKINHQIGLTDYSEERLIRKHLALGNLESLLIAKKEYEEFIHANDIEITDLIDSNISGTGIESQREKLIDDFSTRSYIYSNILRKINIDLSVHIGPTELQDQLEYRMKFTDLKRRRGWYILEKKEQKTTDIIKPTLTPIEDEKRISKHFSTYLIIDNNILEKINYHLSFYNGSKELQAQIKRKIPFTPSEKNGVVPILDEKEKLTENENKIASVENKDETEKIELVKIESANIKEILHSRKIKASIKNATLSEPITSDTLPKLPPKIKADIIIEYFKILSNKDDPNRFFEVETKIECFVYKIFDYGITDYDHLDYYKDLGLKVKCNKKQFASMFYNLKDIASSNKKISQTAYITLVHFHFPHFRTIKKPNGTISRFSYQSFFERKDVQKITKWGKKTNPEITITDLIRKYKK